MYVCMYTYTHRSNYFLLLLLEEVTLEAWVFCANNIILRGAIANGLLILRIPFFEVASSPT